MPACISCICCNLRCLISSCCSHGHMRMRTACSSGEDPNLWRALYEPDAAGPPREGASQQGSGKLSAVMRHIPLMHALAKNQVVVPDDDPQVRLACSGKSSGFSFSSHPCCDVPMFPLLSPPCPFRP